MYIWGIGVKLKPSLTLWAVGSKVVCGTTCSTSHKLAIWANRIAFATKSLSTRFAFTFTLVAMFHLTCNEMSAELAFAFTTAFAVKLVKLMPNKAAGLSGNFAREAPSSAFGL